MKFEAVKIDLDLELTLLSGETENVSPKIKMSGKNCLHLIEQWRTLEGNAEKDKDGNLKNGITIICTELSLIYPKTKDWFLDNLDIGTIKEILSYVATTMGGVQKKPESLN